MELKEQIFFFLLTEFFAHTQFQNNLKLFSVTFYVVELNICWVLQTDIFMSS